MLRIVAALLLLAGALFPANAEILPLGMQYDGPVGYSEQWTGGQNGGCRVIGQCFTIAPGQRFLGCTGTQTIKAAGLELLARIVVGKPGGTAVPVWTGHQITSTEQPHSTVVIATPPAPNNPADNTYLTGDGTINIWIEYQLGNNSGQPTLPGGAWEMQAICSFTY